MSRRAPTMGELVLRPVVRKHIDSEWMSKMSAKEYRTWEDNERLTLIICKYPEYEHDIRIKKTIELKELEYRLRKDRNEKNDNGK